MSSARPTQQHEPPLLERDPVSYRSVVLPSWFASFVAHLLILVLVSTGLQSCGSPSPGVSAEDSRQVGIYVKSANVLIEREASDRPDPTAVDADNPLNSPNQSADASRAQHPLLPEVPPVPVELPHDDALILGPGALPNPAQAGALFNPLEGNAGKAAVRRGDLGHGETNFFNIKEKGVRFVYVVDSSGSMAFYNAMLVAKSELKASLEALDETQQFQIIFYTDRVRMMASPGARPALFWGTDVSRTKARQFIDVQQPHNGTDHLPALKSALRLNPDVVFLLTDADEPRLSAGQLAEIARLNQGKARIHCIEFGVGPGLGAENFLKKLARDNGGTYQYHNVVEFQRPGR